MSKFPRPRKFEIYRASLPVGDAEILLLSSDEANALRQVVLFCELFPGDAALSLDAPTNVLLLPEESGLADPRVAHIGNVFTLPKSAIVELSGAVRSRPARRKVDFALELLFGLRAWVE